MISWNDLIESLKGEVQDKSKNPFFGAFIVTWCIRHWEAVFIIFNFKDDFSMDEKINRIKLYFDGRPEYDFWITIGYTFGVILLGYILLNLARIFSNVSEKILTPLIYQWTAGKASIVPRDMYDNALQREKKAIEKLENEISRRISYQREIEELETKLGKISAELEQVKIKNLDETESPSSSYVKARTIISEFSKEKMDTILRLLGMIDNRQRVKKNQPMVETLEKEEIITFISNGGEDDGFYKITPFGREFLEVLMSER